MNTSRHLQTSVKLLQQQGGDVSSVSRHPVPEPLTCKSVQSSGTSGARVHARIPCEGSVRIVRLAKPRSI